MPPPRNDNDPLAYRRRKRHGVTAAALLAAVLSALVYQCNGKAERPARPAAEGMATAQRDAGPRETARRDGAAAERSGRGRAGMGDVPANGSFDFYLLALSLSPAFCEQGHQSQRECASLDAQSFAATPLTLHGLWPENLRPESYPRRCDGPALRLATSTRAALRRWMPGEADGLAEHEWSRHGRCTGLDPDRYFTAAVDWTQQINAALGAVVRDSAGRRSSVATLRAAANAVRPRIGDSLVFVCKNLQHAPAGRQRRPYLIEVRACLDNAGPDGAPQSLLRCADVQRRDQGCGDSFEIDAP